LPAAPPLIRARCSVPAQTGQQATDVAVVQGACPEVLLREGTAYYTTYAKGGDGDPAKVIHQASISDTTRQCRISGDQLVVTVVVTGRVVGGPEAKSGEVNLPLRVVALDGETVLYSELQKQPVVMTAGGRRSSSSTPMPASRSPPALRALPSFMPDLTRARTTRLDVFLSSRPEFGSLSAQSSSDQPASASTVAGKSAMRLTTVSAPASVSLSACPG
jgi:hypothetical protein